MGKQSICGNSIKSYIDCGNLYESEWVKSTNEIENYLFLELITKTNHKSNVH